VTAQETIVRIQRQLASQGITWREGGRDTFKAGKPETTVRGIATSGRGGRSFSLGIADSATVLAATAAAADAAATLIANAVNVDHPAIERRPARALDPDSDLGDLPVTVAVGPLPEAAIAEALDHGAEEARRLRLCGLIEGAAISLAGQWRLETGGTALARKRVG